MDLRRENDAYLRRSYRAWNPYDAATAIAYRRPQWLRLEPLGETADLDGAAAAAVVRPQRHQVFVGQTPYELQESQLQWLLRIVVRVERPFALRQNRRSSRSPAKRGTGMWFVDFDDEDDATLFCSFHKRLLFHERCLAIWDSQERLERWCRRRNVDLQREGSKPVVIERSAPAA